MRKIIFTLSILFLLSLVSCDVLLKVADTALNSEQPLTTSEVARGLKEALKVGTDTAVVHLAKTNGYYLDNAIKIELPPETAEVVKYARKVPGLNKLIDDVVLQINRSAEDAAKQAALLDFSGVVFNGDDIRVFAFIAQAGCHRQFRKQHVR